ncbi:MAG: sigma-70 family RNA polymerase sigma factor [Clostridium sp.]
MDINSDNLIREIKNRNEKALDYLYDTYLGLAYKIVKNSLTDIGSNEDVEECVSDVFLNVWNNISCYDETLSSFKNWFGAVCKHRAIDYRRRLNKAPNLVEIDNYNIEEDIGLEDRVMLSQDINTLKDIIGKMGKVDRNIFIKKYILNEKVKDISEELGLTRGAIDNRLSRGRKLIKTKWLEVTGRHCYEQK